VSDCCLTPNDQYEELGISKKTNFDKEDNLQITSHSCHHYDSSPPLTACKIVIYL
jgi:hypothetical protein